MTTLTGLDIDLIYTLYQLFAKRGSFQLDEYEGVYKVYSKIKNYLIELKSHEGKESINTVKLELTIDDLRFTLSVLKVCSQRTATDVDDMEKIVELYNKLKAVITEHTETTTEVEEGLETI